jgi:ATP-dependent Clp protease ATP-binding subunit ClpC
MTDWSMLPRRTPDPPSKAAPLSDTASGVLEFAKAEATALNHNYIGTEHILLGLMRHADSDAAAVLGSRTDLQSLRTAVAEMIGVGSAAAASLRLPFTPRAANVLRLAQREVGMYSHPELTPEHLLLGVLREGEGVAAHVLMRLGFDLGNLVSDVSRSFHNGTN